MRAAFHPQKSRTWHVQHRHFAWAAFLRSENSCLKELPLTIGETSVGRTSEGSRYGGSQDEQHGHGPQGTQRRISAAHSVVLQPPDLTGTVLGQLLRGSGKRDAVNSVQEAKAFSTCSEVVAFSRPAICSAQRRLPAPGERMTVCCGSRCAQRRGERIVMESRNASAGG